MRDHGGRLHDLTAAALVAKPGLATALLDLNNAHRVELSTLDPGRLQHLISVAFCARRIGSVDAFLLAFDQTAGYDGHNFLWFKARMARFVYVDRIVVAEHARGLGYARRLYENLFDQAREAGHDRVVCEVNAVPPNPASDRFHAALDFVEVGMAELPGGLKTVRYLERRLSPSELRPDASLGNLPPPSL